MRATPSEAGSTFDRSTRRVLGWGLVVAVVALGIGHLFVVRTIDGMYWGIPAWLWVQLAVLSGLLVLAWAAVRLLTGAGPNPRPRTETGERR